MVALSPPVDRTRRLAQSLPRVSEAVRSQRVFLEDGAKVWNDLRRGLNDVRKDPLQLEALELPVEGCIDDVWEFTLALMLASPKFSRQIMDAVSVLLEAPRWAAGFTSAKGRGRLALWKLSGNSSVAGASPVSLTLALLQLGVPVDEFLPAPEVVENAASYVEELFARAAELNDSQRRLLDASQLGAAWRAAQRERADTAAPSTEDTDRLAPLTVKRQPTEDFGNLTEANQAQAASIEAAGKQGRPGCRKDIVDSLLDVTVEALDCAAKCLEPMLSGYAGEQNMALSAKAKVFELRQRQANLQAQLVVLGPCQSGKTSLTYSLVGFAALPPETPSMVTTRWVHTPSLAVPRLTMPEVLAELLQAWEARLPRSSGTAWTASAPAPAPLGQAIEGLDAVAAALDRIHQTVSCGRRLGVIKSQELEKLSRPSMSISVEVAFAALASLEERLADTGALSLVDLPSPDGEVLWERQDIQNLCRRCLQEADGVLVVVDAARHEAPRWLVELLREAFLQERLLRREDAWVVANRIDQLAEFFCQDGVTEACRRAKERQYGNYHDVILGQDHVIPTAAHLSLLAIYGLRQVTKFSALVLAGLTAQPWFAQACALLFGVKWASHVRNMELGKWRQSMRELQLLGQVTGPLANSVLKTAYVKMLPRSVARVMLELSQLISHFVASLRALEGGAAIIDAEQLRAVFQSYLEDVQRRVRARRESVGPSDGDARQLAAAKCDRPVLFEDPDSAELNEKYFILLAREAIGNWQPHYVRALAQCCEEASRAHQKWQRSIDFYLTKGGVDAATKQKVLLDSKNLRLGAGTEGQKPPLDDQERDRIVLQHAAEVPMTKSKQLFQKTRKAYLITPEHVSSFLVDLCGSWTKACAAEVERRCIQPIQRNFEEMVQSIEELNSHRLAGIRPKAWLHESFDFDFARRLEEVLPRVASFNAQQGDGSDVIEAEAERCERFCEEVRAVLRQILSPAAPSAPGVVQRGGARPGARPSWEGASGSSRPEQTHG